MDPLLSLMSRSVLQVKFLIAPHVFWHLRREITKDDEYTLFNVTVFKKVKDEYLHKCREHKWVLRRSCRLRSFTLRLIRCFCGTFRFLAREFAFDDEAEQRQQQEMEEASAEEKELWVGSPLLSYYFAILTDSTRMTPSLPHRPTSCDCRGPTFPRRTSCSYT